MQVKTATIHSGTQDARGMPGLDKCGGYRLRVQVTADHDGLGGDVELCRFEARRSFSAASPLRKMFAYSATQPPHLTLLTLTMASFNALLL
jgi:hypothetical protein